MYTSAHAPYWNVEQRTLERCLRHLVVELRLALLHIGTLNREHWSGDFAQSAVRRADRGRGGGRGGERERERGLQGIPDKSLIWFYDILLTPIALFRRKRKRHWSHLYRAIEFTKLTTLSVETHLQTPVKIVKIN